MKPAKARSAPPCWARTGRAPEVEDDSAPEAVPVEDEDVPLVFSARAWKAAKLLGPDSTAFAEKTIPCPQ